MGGADNITIVLPLKESKPLNSPERSKDNKNYYLGGRDNTCNHQVREWDRIIHNTSSLEADPIKPLDATVPQRVSFLHLQSE